jgi:hypothetical protein
MVQMVQVPRWRAFDGEEFETEAEARAHEDANYPALLVGLTAEQIAAALERKPEALALSEALERAGNTVKRARYDVGELKRQRRKGGEAAAAGTTEPADSETPPSTEQEAA